MSRLIESKMQESEIDEGWVILDIDSMVKSPHRTRESKARLELRIAKEWVSRAEGRLFSRADNIRLNPTDPPDIFLDVDGVPHGIELVQILPPGRKKKDAAIAKLRLWLQDHLQQAGHFSGAYFSIRLVDDFASNLNLPSARQLTAAINEFMKSSIDPDQIIFRLKSPVPEVAEVVIGVSRGERRKPVITFSASLTKLNINHVYEQSLKIRKKKIIKAGLPSVPPWLLIWASDPSIAHSEDLVYSTLKNVFTDRGCYKDIIFYVYNP